MSEPLQPPVPPHGQPSPQPQASPQPPLAQPSPQQQQPYPQQQQPAQQYVPQQPQPQQPYPQQQPYPPQQPPTLEGAPQGYPPAAPPYSPAAQQAAPQYPSAPGYPAAGAPAYAPRSAASGQSLGRTALIIALITFGIGLVTTFLFPILLYSTLGFSSWFFNGVTSFLVIVGSGIALALGLIAIRRPGSPVLAGIAIGISASEIAAGVFSWLSSLFYSFA